MPELLAPAGSERALVAAVQSGADAVYAGLREFSARRGADNFTPSELGEAARYAHLRGTKLYLTVNVLLLPDEMHRALSACARAREAGVDAFIVQDLGLARLLRAHLPDVPTHASTQMSTHDAKGIEFLSDLGFSRVTLARELALEEVARLAAGPIAVEVFVHGALCYCYSGQCLLSSLAGGRSGNRGLCVQACRMKYELIDGALGPVEAGGQYPMSTKDLSAIDLIPGLARAGVASLKIEGRLKSAEYVATVVDVYRRALDRYAACPGKYAVPREDREALDEVFSRGFTPGYLEGIRDERIMSPARPSDRGVTIGRVAGCDAKSGACDIKLSRELGLGDEIEIWVRKGGRIKAKVSALKSGGADVEVAQAGSIATVRVERPAVMGDRVFRVSNARLTEAVRARLRPAGATRTVPVDLTAHLRAGEALRLSASASDGTKVELEGPIVQQAKQRPLDPATVREHLERLGGTAYSPGRTDVEMTGDCFLPIKQLNETRAGLIELLDEPRLAPFSRQPLRHKYSPPKPRARKALRPLLCVSCDDMDVARELAGLELDRIYFDVSFERDWRRLAGDLGGIAEVQRGAGGRFALRLPAITRDSELEELGSLISTLRDSLDGIVAGSPGQIRRYAARGLDILGDVALNVTNNEAVDALTDAGVRRATLSNEITGMQIHQIAGTTKTPLEAVVFGRLQVMVAEHCLYCVPGSCRGCSGRSGALRDANDFVFPARVDRACRTRIYNPFDLSLIRQLPELAGAGVDSVRLDLGDYGAAAAVDIVEGVRRVLELLPDAVEAASEAAERMADGLSNRARYTTGHYYRALQ